MNQHSTPQNASTEAANRPASVPERTHRSLGPSAPAHIKVILVEKYSEYVQLKDQDSDLIINWPAQKIPTGAQVGDELVLKLNHAQDQKISHSDSTTPIPNEKQAQMEERRRLLEELIR